MKILYVCTGNTCRSPMAQEVTRITAEQMGKDVQATSAGVYAQTGMPASVGAQSAVMLFGGDLSDHRAAELYPDLIEEADLVLCMGKGHLAAVQRMAPGAAKDKAYTLAQYAFGQDRDIQDPFGGDDSVYQDCLAQIGEAVRAVLEKV